MIQPLKHHAVNWVDGMKISREHFVQQENYLVDAIRDSNSLPLNSFNYGLLPLSADFGAGTVFEIQSTATNDAQLIIRKCSAVTKAGHRIEISDYRANVRDISRALPGGQEPEGQYYILASVNPFEKIPFGEIDSEEIPPRHPYTKPGHRIELVETSILDSAYAGGNHLVLGRVAIHSGITQIDQAFIPPCTAVESHQSLIDHYNAYSSSLSNLRQYSFRIIQKTAHKNQNTPLAENVKALCKSIIHHLGENYFEFKNMAYTQPPIYLMNIFSKLALHIYNEMQMMVPAELEEMLNYSLEWSEVTPHTILNRLTAVAEINYDHHETGAIFEGIALMLKSLEQIMGKLSELDYIGQRRENIIVNEQEVRSTNDPKKGWSVID